MKTPSRPIIVALVAAVLVAVAVGAVYLLKPELVDTAVTSLAGVTDELAAEPTSSTPVPAPAEKAEATVSASAKAPAKGAGAGSTSTKPGGSTASGGSSETKPKPKPGGTDTKPVAGMKVRVLWWNDTEATPADGFEIVCGTSSVKPGTGTKSGTGTVGPLTVGTKLLLVVYPDGRSGTRIAVPFTLTKIMEPDSDVDAIHVEVSDTSVRVLGNAVEGFDRTFPRF